MGVNGRRVFASLIKAEMGRRHIESPPYDVNQSNLYETDGIIPFNIYVIGFFSEFLLMKPLKVSHQFYTRRAWKNEESRSTYIYS